MSKKLAEGIKTLVLDVKFGSGAFMESYEKAAELAKQLKSIGENNNLSVTALITSMNQPLGRFSGNTLEIKECLDILKNKSCVHDNHDFYHDTRELSLQLAAHALKNAKEIPFKKAYSECVEALTSGAAYKKFIQLSVAQGAIFDAKTDIFSFVKDKEPIFKQDILSPKNGFIDSIDVKALGYLNIELGAGRKKLTDKIDPSVGFEMKSYLGKKVLKGESLLSIYARSEKKLRSVEKSFVKAFMIKEKSPPQETLIHQVL